MFARLTFFGRSNLCLHPRPIVQSTTRKKNLLKGGQGAVQDTVVATVCCSTSVEKVSIALHLESLAPGNSAPYSTHLLKSKQPFSVTPGLTTQTLHNCIVVPNVCAPNCVTKRVGSTSFGNAFVGDSFLDVVKFEIPFLSRSRSDD